MENLFKHWRKIDRAWLLWYALMFFFLGNFYPQQSNHLAWLPLIASFAAMMLSDMRHHVETRLRLQEAGLDNVYEL